MLVEEKRQYKQLHQRIPVKQGNQLLYWLDREEVK